MTRFKLLFKYQFRPKTEQSPHHALITLIDNITRALDDGNRMTGVFLDLRKLSIVLIIAHCFA